MGVCVECRSGAHGDIAFGLSVEGRLRVSPAVDPGLEMMYGLGTNSVYSGFDSGHSAVPKQWIVFVITAIIIAMIHLQALTKVIELLLYQSFVTSRWQTAADIPLSVIMAHLDRHTSSSIRALTLPDPSHPAQQPLYHNAHHSPNQTQAAA